MSPTICRCPKFAGQNASRTVACFAATIMALACPVPTAMAQPGSNPVSPSELTGIGPEEADQQKLDFFEKQIRPVLLDRCYKCHSRERDEPAGGLRLDTREGIRKGGDIGPAVVPGDPDESLLLSAVRYESLEMPPDEKLDDEVIEAFLKWILDGAVDPRDED